MKNAWPVGIVIFFIVFISGVVGFTVWSAHHRDDLVAPDYYEQELRFQERIDATVRAGMAHLTPTVEYDREASALMLTFAPAEAVQSATGTVTLYRPSDASLDRAFPFDPDPAGVLNIPISLARGLWRVRVEWYKRDQTYFAEEAVRVP